MSVKFLQSFLSTDMRRDPADISADVEFVMFDISETYQRKKKIKKKMKNDNDLSVNYSN